MKDLGVLRELEVKLKLKIPLIEMPIISNSTDVLNALRVLYSKKGEVGLQESFIVFFLNQGNQLIGTYSSLNNVSIKIITGIALKCQADKIIVTTNKTHLSHSVSRKDLSLVSQLKQAFEMFEMDLMDYIIVNSIYEYTSLKVKGMV